MKNTLFAKGMRYLKESKELVEKMCDVMKELLAESERETRFKSTLTNIRNMMKNLKLTAKQAMDALEIPADEQEVYIKVL